jgi:hypothetical protein
MSVISYAIGWLNKKEGGSPHQTLRDFVVASDIRTSLKKNARPDEQFDEASMLLIFETRTQHTWLVATNAALYCVVDIRRQPHPRKLWRIGRDELVVDNKLTLQLTETAVTDGDFYIVINRQRPRKFTRRLFEAMSIRESIENMLRNAFGL